MTLRWRGALGAVLLSGVLFLLSGCGRKQSAQADLKPARDAAAGLLIDDTRVIADGAESVIPSPGMVVLEDLLHLDSTEVASGARVTGHAMIHAGKNELFRLLWVDAYGRVAASYDLAAPKQSKDDSGAPFSIPRPPGALGWQHKLVLIHAQAPAKDSPKNTAPHFELLARASFQFIKPAPKWNDYTAMIDGCEVSHPDFWKVLQSNGINAGYSRFGQSAQPCVKHDLPFCAEAIPAERNLLALSGPWDARCGAYAKSRDAKLFERQPSIFDDAALNVANAALAEAVASRRKTQPLCWSIGDGLSLTNGANPFDYDVSPQTLAVFREWLEDRYQGIQALNKQWGTNFKSFKDVVPPTTDETKAALNPLYAEKFAALKKSVDASAGFKLGPSELHKPGAENFSAWCDYREFCDFAFARIVREYRSEIRTLTGNQNALVGISGAISPSAFGGYDWTQLARSIDWAESHDHPLTREMLRGLSPQSRRITALSGSGAADSFALWDGWISGDNGCLLTPHDKWFKAPEFQIAAEQKPLLEDIKMLTGGLTILRDGAVSGTDAIAIYYSPRSIQLHWMLDSESDGAGWLSRNAGVEASKNSGLLQLNAWRLLLEDLGYKPQFVSAEQLVNRALQSKTRILILPKVLSLNDAEAAELREFAKSGGVIIADGECGTFDAHGRRHSSSIKDGNAPEPQVIGALDAEFGIARKDLNTLELNGEFSGDANARVAMKDPVSNLPIGPISDELRLLEPGIVAIGTSGHASSPTGIPSLLTRIYGQGRFVYLNLSMQDYASLRIKEKPAEFKFEGYTDEEYANAFGAPRGGEALRLVIGDMLSEVLPENPITVRDENGAAIRGVKRARFLLGHECRLYALLPVGDVVTENGNAVLSGVSLKEKTTARVGLTKKATERHWYDVLSGEYLGKGAGVSVALEPNRATLLAALPYRVDRLSLKIRRTDIRGVFKINAAIAGDNTDTGLHAFKVEVLDANGNVLPYYSRTATANGSYNFDIIMALNEPSGIYRLRVTDILTGQSAQGDLVKEQCEYSDLNP